MIDLNLNFIPKKDKQNVFIFAILSWSANIMGILLFLLILFNLYFLLLNFLLIEQESMLQKRSHEVSKNYFFYNQEIININNHLNLITKAASNYAILTPRFWKLIDTVPDGIKLNNLVLSLENDKKIIILGSAKNRESLWEYKKILEQISWVISVDLPTSQLIQKDDINFNILLNVDPLK